MIMHAMTNLKSRCLTSLSSAAHSAKEAITARFSSSNKSVQVAETPKQPVMAKTKANAESQTGSPAAKSTTAKNTSAESTAAKLCDRKTEQTHYTWNTLIGCSLGVLFGEVGGMATGASVGLMVGSLLGPVTAITGGLIGAAIGGFTGGFLGGGLGMSTAYHQTPNPPIEGSDCRAESEVTFLPH